MGKLDKIANAIDCLGLTAKSLAKILIQSRKCRIKKCHRDKPLLIMGNGPSLSRTIADHTGSFDDYDVMMVNFAASTPEFFDIKPAYYILADPVFFNPESNANVRRLNADLNRVDWEMKLLTPMDVSKSMIPGGENGHISCDRFNFIGAEGSRGFERRAFDSRRAMPRPRNVLVPALMTGLWMGYDTIYVAGADHSWTRTLEVDDENFVVTVQPHFYADNAIERDRVRQVYGNVRLHEILYSFHVAFKSYFAVRRYADHLGARIVNVTPGSFIDAFERGALPS